MEEVSPKDDRLASLCFFSLSAGLLGHVSSLALFENSFPSEGTEAVLGTWKNERKGWGLITGPHVLHPPPGPCPELRSFCSQVVPTCCLVQNTFLVSRHLRFGWDTIQVNRDALWDLKQKKKSKGRVFSLVFPERGGELLH